MSNVFTVSINGLYIGSTLQKFRYERALLPDLAYEDTDADLTFLTEEVVDVGWDEESRTVYLMPNRYTEAKKPYAVGMSEDWSQEIAELAIDKARRRGLAIDESYKNEIQRQLAVARAKAGRGK